MCGEQGFIAVRETVHLVKFIGKGCSIFFSSAYVTLLSTTGYKVLKYSSRIHMVYLAAQQNKLIQFPVCATIGVPRNVQKLCCTCKVVVVVVIVVVFSLIRNIDAFAVLVCCRHLKFHYLLF